MGKKTQLAPGFRFHPTDVELVRYYLKRKVMGKKLRVDAIAEVDIYKFEPADLPDLSYIKSGDLKWHFFCPKEKKYSTGVRANRGTLNGYWKTTGKDRVVLCNDEVVGKIKTLVYHFGKSPRGERTDWVMHEYRIEDKALMQMNVPQDTYVLCIVFKKDGLGPKNGAQYGAPFKEEDWSDDDDDEELTDIPPESCVSDLLPATTTTSELPCPIDVANTPISNATHLDSNPTNGSKNDDINSMLDIFRVEDELERHVSDVSAPVCVVEEEDIFKELPDLSCVKNNNMIRTPSFDELDNYIELQDLTTDDAGSLSWF